ncbi:MAG TPA: translocation/assembly module TamB domain-containing protein [Steroidobacteraceae bacterium]
MRRRYRILLWTVLVMLLLPVWLAVAVYVLANTDDGRRLIERTTARLTRGNVELIGLAGHFPQRLQLKRLELRDPQGLWLAIDDLALQWSPSALLSYRADVASLSAARVEMPRAPAYPNDHKPSRAHHWPTVRLDRLEVTRADLGAALTGTDVAFELSGSGTWISPQQAALRFDARRLDAVPSVYHAVAQFDAQQLQAQLDLQEDAGGPLAHLAQIPDVGALSIHVSASGPRSAVQTVLRLKAGALTANADGTLDARSGAADLKLTLDAGAMSPRPGIEWQELHLQGQWRGLPRSPTTSAQLRAGGLIVPGVKLPTLSATLAGQSGTLTLDARGSGLTVTGKVGALLAASPLEAHATMHLDQPGRPIDVSASHPLISATGRWSGNAADGNATLTASVRDLRPFAALAALDLNGSGTWQASLHTAPGATRIELSSKLQVSGGRSALAPLLAPRARFEGVVSIAQGVTNISSAQLVADRLQAALHGSYAGDGMDMAWKVSLPDLAVLSPRFAGTATAQGSLKGAAPHLAVVADVDGKVGVNGTQSGALHLKLDAHDLPQRPRGTVNLTGTLDAAPILFDASLEGGADGALEARIDRGSWKSLQARGEVHVPGGQGPPRGQLELDMPHLEDLAGLTGQPLQGSITARLDFDGSAPGGRAHVRVEAKDAGVPAQQLSVLHLSGNIDSVTKSPTLALRLSTRTLIKDVPSNLHAQIKGPLDAIEMQVSAATEGEATTQSHVNTTAVLDMAQHELRVSALELKYRGEQAQLQQPMVLSFSDGLAVDQLQLGVGSTVLKARGRISPTLDLTASLHDITSDLLHPWLPNVKADGQVDIDLELHGSATAPTGSVRLIGRGLRAHSGSVRGLPAGNVSIEAQLQQTVAQLKIEADAGDRLGLHIDGQAPLNRDAPIALKASGNFDLVLLNPILEAGGQRLHGQAKLDADIAGTPANPEAHGSVQLTNADVQDYSRGLHLTDINGTLSADGQQVRLQNLVAHAGPGTITAEGSLGLAGAMPLTVKLTAHNARPLASDLITANIDMDLNVTGPLRQKLDARGNLHIIRADLNIPNGLPPSVAVLDVRKPGVKVQPPKPSNFEIDLNLRVDAPRAVFVRGRGLDSELGGELHVTGTVTEPAISGGFDMRKGTINLAGSTLTFTSGRLSFNGTGVRKKIDPTLDFTATNISNGVTYTLHVGGYADAPAITLSSAPEQPQDVILSRLLFGADPAQLSTLQIAQIAAALATMTGVGGGGLSPLTAVQRKLRLDRLAISGSTSSTPTATAGGNAAQGTSTGASIEAGRYVSSRVFVGAKQFTTGTTQAEVQVDLTKNLKIQTTLATGGGTVQGETPQNDPGSSVGLSYQFEY